MASLFPAPEFEPPERGPSWALLAGLLAAGAFCVVVILLVSGCGASESGCKELIGLVKGIPVYRDCEAP